MMSIDSVLKQVEVISGNASEFKCCCCHTVSIESKFGPCGHLFCDECVRYIVDEEGEIVCPVDHLKISLDLLTTENDFKLKIMNLSVTCPNRNAGCSFVGKLFHLKIHLQTCGTGYVMCPQGCQRSLMPSDLPTHLQHECDHRYVICSFCRTPVVFNKLKDHTDICDQFQSICPNNCGAIFTRIEMEKHLEQCRSKNVTMQCRFLELGCNFQGHETVMQQHEENVNAHLNIMLNANLRNKLMVECAIAKMNADVEELRNENQLLKNALDNSAETMDLIKRSTNKISKQLFAAKKNSKTLNELEDDQETINGESTLIAEQLEEIQILVNNIDLDLQSSKNVIKQTQYEQGETLKNLVQPVKTKPKKRYYNGNFVWKLKNYAKFREDVESGLIIAKFSEPFYTHEFGYKMCLSVYLNGNDTRLGDFLGINLVIMSSSRDQILSWPVEYQATITLFNQADEKLHREKSVQANFSRPDIGAKYGQSNGCPLFFPLDQLAEKKYLLRDTLFIKVEVSVLI